MSRSNSLIVDSVEYIRTAVAVREFFTSRSSVIRSMDDSRVRFHQLPNGYRLPRHRDLAERFTPRVPRLPCRRSTRNAGAASPSGGNLR